MTTLFGMVKEISEQVTSHEDRITSLEDLKGLIQQQTNTILLQTQVIETLKERLLGLENVLGVNHETSFDTPLYNCSFTIPSYKLDIGEAFANILGNEYHDLNAGAFVNTLGVQPLMFGSYHFSYNNRQEVIDFCKAGVEEMLNTQHDGVRIQKTNWKASYIPKTDTVEFEINKEKRVVVALVKSCIGDVWATGIAKCDPNDTFNVHIGKYISLSRAFGLMIPEFVLEHTQPTGQDAQVGDRVDVTLVTGRHIVGTIDREAKHTPYEYWIKDEFASNREVAIDRDEITKVIDDSRL